jgi:GNAT superfamily N-acetyltransferase
MTWTLTADVHGYAAALGDLLAGDPVRHTVALTIIENARARRTPGEIFAWWTDPGGAVTGAISHTPHRPLVLGVLPERGVAPTVELIVSGRIPAGGAAGATGSCIHLGAAWAAATGRAPRLRLAQRLYRLTTLIDPSPGPAGRARPAGPGDVELIAAWTPAFSAEVGMAGPPDVAGFVVDRLSHGGWTLWEDAGGRTVSLAGRSRAAGGAVRIGPVYTPPEHRRLGFAAAVTAAATRAALDAGAGEVVLFTDLANPGTNTLYPTLGYTSVEDRLELEFPPGPT